MPVFLRVVVFLNFAAILLPVAMQYLAASSLLIWLVANKLLLKKELPINFLYDADHNSFYKLYKGLCLFFVLLFCVAVISSFHSAYPFKASKILSEAWHFAAKQSIMPLSVLCGLLALKCKYQALPNLARSIALFVTLYTAYCVAQRYTGIDWIKGFSAVLPENRHAYGVYRLSGFMGHPLSFAYNLIFASIVYGFWGLTAFREGQKSQAFWWFSAAGQTVLMLILSGSRWPVFVFLVTLISLLHRQIIRRWKQALLAFSLVMAGLYFEGSIVSRTKEIYRGGGVSLENVPRLVFWKIHAKMFVDSPVLGVGYSARSLAAVDYYNKNGYNGMERKYSAHNQYLQTLADSGLTGFTVVFGFWVWALMLFQLLTDSTVKKILFSLVLITAISCLMKNVLRDSEFLFGLWVCIATCYLGVPLKDARNSIDGRDTNTEITNNRRTKNRSHSRKDVHL